MSERDIFTAAREIIDPAARSAYLDGACGGDPGLRSRVEALLRAHDQPNSLLDHPAVAAADVDNGATQALTGTPAPGVAVAQTTGGANGASDDEALSFLSPSQRPDSLGRLGHYEVLQVLGRGGFGIVFRAFDEMLQRVVALKVMAPQLAATSPARKRFLREARSSAQVRHENVVQVYEVAEQPLPYLAMEFIPGETLQQWLDRVGPLDVPQVLRIGRQIAEGLAAAHATDLIHRDIKPANVLIEGGHHKVKITDFGLARAADDASISQSGIIAGTPMYMAPEQAKGETLDQRADLFSLGSVVYQMVAGRPPFRANSAVAVLKRVAEDRPRAIREIIPETPQWLCDIIAKLHAKDPDERYQSAREVADVLADCEAQLKANSKLKDYSRIPRGKPTSSRKWKWAAAVLLLVAVLGISIFALIRHFQTQRAAPADRAHLVINGDAGVERIVVRRAEMEVARLTDASPGTVLNPGTYNFQIVERPGFKVKEIRIESTVMGEEALSKTLPPAARFSLTLGRKETAHVFVQMESIATSDQAGWVRLFNGKDLTGWKTHPTLPGNWRVKKGVLVGSGPSRISYLVSERNDYQNFCLRAEVRVHSPEDGSGIFFRAGLATQDFAGTQVLSPPFHEASIFMDQKRVWPPPGSVLLDGQKWVLAVDFLPKANEWFTLEIVAEGPSIMTKVNGHVVVPASTWARTALKPGYILLQQYGPETRVEFRRIEIKELPPTSPAEKPPALAVAPFDAAKAKEHQEASAKQLGVPVETTNSIGMKLRLIPPGKFTMGSAKEEIDFWRKQTDSGWVRTHLDGECPQHEVEITQPVYVGQTEVTVGQFRQFVTARGYKTQAEREGGAYRHPPIMARKMDADANWLNPGFAQTDDHPVVCVSWNDAVEFCNWLSKQEGKNYRLPTEAEWEYSCRAGSSGRWCFGDNEGELLKYARIASNSQGHTWPVAGLKENAWGLHDMHGNVWEWCQDVYHSDYYKTSPPKDPPGPGTGWTRVARGGSWGDAPLICRSACRSQIHLLERHNNVGFRVVLVVSPSAGVQTKSGAKDQPPPPAIAPFTDADAKRIAGLPAAKQVQEVRKELMRRNPGFDGQMEPKIEDGTVTEFKIVTDKVMDIAPIRVFNALRVLECSGTYVNKPNGLLADLTPLQRMNLSDLTNLDLHFTQVSDAGLARLKDLKALRHLNLGGTKVGDAGAAQFKDCKNLSFLSLGETQVSDAALAHFNDCKYLTHLYLYATKVSDVGLANFKGLPLRVLWIEYSGITDLTPLQGMPLEEVRLTPKNITKGMDILRDMKSLKTIGIVWNQAWPAAEFWERYDKGEFKK